MIEKRVPQSELPPAADVRPQFLWIWRCWHRLSLDRPWHGAGLGAAQPGNIPWTTVQAWAAYHRLSEGEFAMLDRCVRELDIVFRAWTTRQQGAP